MYREGWNQMLWKLGESLSNRPYIVRRRFEKVNYGRGKDAVGWFPKEKCRGRWGIGLT